LQARHDLEIEKDRLGDALDETRPLSAQRVVRQRGPGRLPGGRAVGRAIVGCG
jgi:hypothetical protein